MSAVDFAALRAAGISRPMMGSAELPPDIDAAYAIAARSVHAQGCSIAAWKLGGTNAGTRATFATGDVYFGALLADEVWYVPSDRMVVPKRPFRGEAEIALRVKRDVSAQEAASGGGPDLFDACAASLECPWSIVSDLPGAGLPALLMDRCAAGALFVGPPLALEMERNARLDIAVNGRVVASGEAASALLMTPLDAALRAVTLIGRHSGGLLKGQWIATGGITACVDLPPEGTIALLFNGEQVFSLQAGCLR